MSIIYGRIEGNNGVDSDLLIEAMGLLERGFMRQYMSELKDAVYQKYDAEKDVQERPEHADYHKQRVAVASAKIKKLENLFEILYPVFGENSKNHYSVVFKDIDK